MSLKTARGDAKRRASKRASEAWLKHEADTAAVARAGRPPKLTKDLADRVANLVRLGNYVEVAAGSLGVSRDIFKKWCALGAPGGKGRSLHRYFFTELHKAADEAQTLDIAVVVNAISGGGIAAAKLALNRLARKHPALWGLRKQIEVSGSSSGAPPVGIAVYAVPPVQLPAEDSDEIAVSGLIRQPAREKSTAPAAPPKPAAGNGHTQKNGNGKPR